MRHRKISEHYTYFLNQEKELGSQPVKKSHVRSTPATSTTLNWMSRRRQTGSLASSVRVATASGMSRPSPPAGATAGIVSVNPAILSLDGGAVSKLTTINIPVHARKRSPPK